jgi:hypothetical protein
VKEGEEFWMFLPPGSVTGLRHEWTHPAIACAVPTNGDDEDACRGCDT